MLGAIVFTGTILLFLRIDDEWLFVGLLIAAWALFFINACAEHYAKQKDGYKSRLDWQFDRQKKELESAHKERQKVYEQRERDLLMLLKDKTPYKTSSLMYADVQTYIFEDNRRYLISKRHPAYKSADVVKEMRKIAKEHIGLYRATEYKLKMLLGEFPYLAPYLEDETGDAIPSLMGADLEDAKEGYDKVRDFLSQEEYDNLSVTERNQLALDRYNKGHKSNWVVGVEYEMYVEYLYREMRGWKTIPHGSIHKLADLGRDVVAEKGDTIHIIQCKRYSADKLIHENTICQLYGTTIEYELGSEGLFTKKITPVLYSTADLSPMAEKFAERLGVKFHKVPMGKYPQIKCNIGQGGEKIYHLPFDQQYYNAIIDKQGEFYAWDVKGAEAAGFRRAKKYIFNK